MTNPTPLSPAAQAVRMAAVDAQAGHEYCQYKEIAAAALRAAALHIENASDGLGSLDILRGIAAELEGAQ